MGSSLGIGIGVRRRLEQLLADRVRPEERAVDVGGHTLGGRRLADPGQSADDDEGAGRGVGRRTLVRIGDPARGLCGFGFRARGLRALDRVTVRHRRLRPVVVLRRSSIGNSTDG
jgi:hypothetical protein